MNKIDEYNITDKFEYYILLLTCYIKYNYIVNDGLVMEDLLESLYNISSDDKELTYKKH